MIGRARATATGAPPPGGGRTERHGLSSPIASLNSAANRRAKLDGVPGGGDARVETPPPGAPNELAPHIQHSAPLARGSGANSWRAALPPPGGGGGRACHREGR